jgi:hypothetical protein
VFLFGGLGYRTDILADGPEFSWVIVENAEARRAYHSEPVRRVSELQDSKHEDEEDNSRGTMPKLPRLIQSCHSLRKVSLDK